MKKSYITVMTMGTNRSEGTQNRMEMDETKEKKGVELPYPPYKVSSIWFSFMGFPNLILINMLECCFLKNI